MEWCVFLFLYLLFLVLFVNSHVSSISKRLLMYVIILVNMYQRPDIYGAVILYLYSCMVYIEDSCKHIKGGSDYGDSNAKIGVTAIS